MNPRHLLFATGLCACVVAFGGCSKSTASESAHDAHAHDHAAAPERATKATAATAGEAMCPEHNVADDACGICKPQLATTLKVGEAAKVRLAAADSATLAGVQVGAPEVGAIADGVDCYAELEFNQSRLAVVPAPVGGIVQEVAVEPGQRVETGTTLARLSSAAIGEAVAKAVLTHQTLERERRLREQRVSSQKDLEQAEADHRAACQQARAFGFSEEDVERMRVNPAAAVFLDIRAPFAGEVVERHAVQGTLVESGKPLFVIADRTTLWATLNVPEAAAARLHGGEAVELRLDAIPGRTFAGKLTWVAAEVDEKTRMVRARAVVANADGVLRAKMFGRARILTRTATQAVIVPATAIQRIEGRPFLFVKVADDLYDARVVELGATQSGKAEVVRGLSPREIVALDHVFPLKSAFLISRLGAGCADD